MANGFSKSHDVKVSVVQKPTGELYALVKVEGSNPKGDVWWAGSGDAFLQAAEEGLFESYRSPQLEIWSVRLAEQSVIAASV